MTRPGMAGVALGIALIALSAIFSVASLYVDDEVALYPVPLVLGVLSALYGLLTTEGATGLGRRAIGALPNASGRRGIVAEVLVLWLVTLVAIRLVVEAQRGLGLHEIVLAAVPVLFMYAPVVLCRLRGVDSWDYPLALPAFRDRPPWVEALKLNAVAVGVIVVPWLVVYHLWTTTLEPHLWAWVFDRPVHLRQFLGIWPSSILKLVAYHLFFVAIPEELFYRGYLQTRLDEAFGTRWRVLGANIGPGLLITSLIFAAGHSIVQVQWWHFAIFFPSLVFGWMRARTGQIVAGAFFHAWSNVTVSTLDTLYGVVPPQ